MTSGGTIPAWLILEQEEDRKHWGEAAMEKCVLRESGLSPLGPDEPREIATGAIYLMFLPGNQSRDILPRAFFNAPETELRVWCHYGGDINPARLGEAWKIYSRLTPADRDRLFPLASNKYPCPFSSNQSSAWLEDFQEAKEAVAERRQSPKVVFETVTNSLREAWHKAGASDSVHTLVQQLKTAMPAVLTAKFLRAAFAERHLEPEAELQHFFKTFHATGITSCIESMRAFPKESGEAFRVLMHRIAQTHQFLKHKSPNIPACDTDQQRLARDRTATLGPWIVSVQACLDRFIEKNHAESEEASRRLAANPHKMQGGK